MNKKIPTPLAILIILLAIAAIIGVTLWFCPEKETVPSPDEIVDWQIYRNEEYGFEVKYPLDYTEQKVEFDTNLLNIMKEDYSSSYYFQIDVRKNYNINQITSTIEEAKEINIEGHLGYEYFYIEGAGVSEVVLIQIGQDALNISFDYICGQNCATVDHRKSYVRDILNQILSTFRLLE